MLLGIADHEPKNCNEFFEPLVSELKKLGRQGLIVKDQNWRVKLKFVTADLPAKKKVCILIIFDDTCIYLVFFV